MKEEEADQGEVEVEEVKGNEGTEVRRKYGIEGLRTYDERRKGRCWWEEK